MAYVLRKTKTFVHPCLITQVDEAGKQHQGKLRVRFNAIPRDKWDEMTKSGDDDDRLLYDVFVAGIEDEVKVADEDGTAEVALDKDQALAAVRQDLSVTGQIVDQGLEVLFGAAAKNARRSRSR